MGSLTSHSAIGVALQLRFFGANPDASLEVGQRGAGTLNYLVGNRRAWRRGLPTYRAPTYRELWPGIDVVFRGRGGTLKYEFHGCSGAGRPPVCRGRGRLRVAGPLPCWDCLAVAPTPVLRGSTTAR